LTEDLFGHTLMPGAQQKHLNCPTDRQVRRGP